MTIPDERVMSRFAHVSDPVHRSLYGTDQSRRAIEEAAKRNALNAAMGEGLMPADVGRVDAKWTEMPEAEAVMLSRVDRDVDPWRTEPAAAADAEEARRRDWYRGAMTLRVEFDVEARPEHPELRQLDEETAAVLARQGAEVLAAGSATPLVCGGAFRRHDFTTRDAEWLRDAVIQSAWCSVCERVVTRDELLERAKNEQEHGVCRIDGDAFVLRDGALVCPTCP